MNKTATRKVSISEVHAYIHIMEDLTGKKGWQRSQVLTQGECLAHPEIKKYLGLNKPENIVEINPTTFYVIEAKNDRKKLDQAVFEAREDYANAINLSSKIQSPLITGIAGNYSEGYVARSEYLDNGEWKVIKENGVEVTSLLSSQQVESILQQKTAELLDVEITEDEFLETAESINSVLHENSINKDYRARFISAILLAMSDGKDIDLAQDCSVLIDNINSRVKHILNKHDKLAFSNFIKIDEPSSSDNHVKVKEAIKSTYQALLDLNIRSAMNSGKDVLGKFYEVFLKYGNGAKDIGIVLTPRHITRFASSVLDINHKDLVLDPACGTGGFLVSAFDEVRRKTSDKSDFENFRVNGMYGIEEQDSVIALAMVNMIFRGDGKNNMIEGNCFRKWLDGQYSGKQHNAKYLSEDKPDRTLPITKVMMNPPFALKKGDEKEYRFIEHALKQMEDGGLLFAILPMSVLVEKGVQPWRRNALLKQNRLKAVVSFPEDLFYPVGVITVGLFVEKGVPHNYEEDRVYFARCATDGFSKKKGVRKENPAISNSLQEIQEELALHMIGKLKKTADVPEFKKFCLLDKEDRNCELVPEAYVDSRIPTQNEIEGGIEELIRESVAFKIRFNDKLTR